MAGAVRLSACTNGCIREIFESRYLRAVPVRDDDDDGADVAATANVQINSTELFNWIEKKKKTRTSTQIHRMREKNELQIGFFPKNSHKKCQNANIFSHFRRRLVSKVEIN